MGVLLALHVKAMEVLLCLPCVSLFYLYTFTFVVLDCLLVLFYCGLRNFGAFIISNKVLLHFMCIQM